MKLLTEYKPLPNRLEKMKEFFDLSNQEMIEFKRKNSNDFEDLYKLLPKKGGEAE